MRKSENNFSSIIDFISNYRLLFHVKKFLPVCEGDKNKYIFREKLHGLEYPPGERIIIRPVANDKKPTQEKLFPFEGEKIQINKITF